MTTRFISLAFLAVSCLGRAADVSGTWKAEFDTQIGVQKYAYTLKQDGATITGKAVSEINGEKRETELKQGRLEGDTVSFVEMLNFQGNELRMTYQGKLADNEFKFTREVGEFAKEEFIAKREAPPAPLAGASGRGGRGGQPIVLGPDDKPVVPPAPDGFNEPRQGIPHGLIAIVEYDSKSVGNKRKALVYTPPG